MIVLLAMDSFSFIDVGQYETLESVCIFDTVGSSDSFVPCSASPVGLELVQIGIRTAVWPKLPLDKRRPKRTNC
jgi:hypothetical protein